jgi:hypothetical protein
MDAEKIRSIIPSALLGIVNRHKTTSIAVGNIIFFMILLILWIRKDITADEFAIVLAGGTSAITSILGYFTADKKE